MNIICKCNKINMNTKKEQGKVYVEDIKTKKRIDGTLLFDYKINKVVLTFGPEVHRRPLENDSHFRTIRNLDETLNKNGLRLLCNATSLDVWPIGLSGSMGSARTAVRLPLFEEVSVYEYSPSNKYATREDQLVYMKKIMDFRPKIKKYTGKIFVYNTVSREKIEGLLLIDMNKEKITVKFDHQECTEPCHEIGYFKTIRKLDQQLNKKGYHLICNATSLDVWPYKIGLTKYTILARRIPTMETVNIFELASWNKYATEDEQIEFVSNHPETSV